MGDLDTRGSHFYLALYWAEALAAQQANAEMAAAFSPVARALQGEADTILHDLLATQGKSQDIGGYYLPDPEKTARALRPSTTFNQILKQLADSPVI